MKEKIKDYPKTPGVYLMKNTQEKIIYVGKAKNLKARLSSYFSNSEQTTKTKFLVSQIRSIEYILTKTEVEAFLLEASLIKKHRPKYNIRLKDDKSYPYIRISTADDFPRLYISRKVVRDGSTYFGPYSSGLSVHQAIKFINRNFKIRDCRDAFMNARKRPCMTHQIGRCTAPCVNLISKENYRKDIESAIMFLRGRDREVIKDLEKRMKLASVEQRFEEAAKYRDSIDSIQHILQKQSVVTQKTENDTDVLCIYGTDQGTCFEMLSVRAGKVISSRPHFWSELDLSLSSEDERDAITSFLNLYYEDNYIPDELYLPIDLGLDLMKLLSAVLKERSKKNVTVRFPTDSVGRKLLEMAEANAKSHFQDYLTRSENKRKGLEEIQRKLDLPSLPLRIECYDISHFQGAESVASQVVFEEGVAAKDHYRRYKIKSGVGGDDFASMQEVIERRFQHSEYAEPQLIVIDGGKGQLRAVQEILKELNKSHLPIVGLAKARVKGKFTDADVKSTEERFYLPKRENPVTFRANSAAYAILVGIRDEAHRFALSYHRKLRESTTLESILDSVNGLGLEKKKSLLKIFKSVDEIRSASLEQILELKGFSQKLAEEILLQLQEDSKE